MSEGSSAYCPEGVVDVSIIVVSLFRNPLGEEAVKFLRDVLSRRTKAAIPVTSVLGRVPRGHEVLKASGSERGEKLVKMLETKSPAFYSRVSLEEVISAIKYATLFRAESWDGYIIELARSLGNHIVYTLDRELERIKDVVVVNPFPENR
jgi:predicted nucleic acid-binding protein